MEKSHSRSFLLSISHSPLSKCKCHTVFKHRHHFHGVAYVSPADADPLAGLPLTLPTLGWLRTPFISRGSKSRVQHTEGLQGPWSVLSEGERCAEVLPSCLQSQVPVCLAPDPSGLRGFLPPNNPCFQQGLPPRKSQLLSVFRSHSHLRADTRHQVRGH